MEVDSEIKEGKEEKEEKALSAEASPLSAAVVPMEETCMVQGVDLKPLLDEFFIAQQEVAESEKAHKLLVERYMNLRLPILNVLKNNIDNHSLEFGDRTFVFSTVEEAESSRPSYETTLHALEEFIGKYTQLPPDQVPQFAVQCANHIWNCIPHKTKETMKVNKKRKRDAEAESKRKDPKSVRLKALKKQRKA